MAEMREFSTGATRNTDAAKHDPEGFLSPLVIERFCQYMHTHRLQADGRLRDSDNWQKGIPLQAYMKSAWRHFLDVWYHHREVSAQALEPLEEALCALLFNVSGYLHEVLKAKGVWQVAHPVASQNVETSPLSAEVVATRTPQTVSTPAAQTSPL